MKKIGEIHGWVGGSSTRKVIFIDDNVYDALTEISKYCRNKNREESARFEFNTDPPLTDNHDG